MLNDILDNLRNNYFNAILELNDESDIINSLPDPEYENFFPIINGLIEKLNEKIKILEEEKNSLNDDKELLMLAQEEIDSLNFKKNLCLNLLEKANKTLLIENDIDTNQKKNLIFAQTSFGNICFERDLKDIPEEYFGTVFEMLQNLESGITEENNEKAKVFTNSAKLSSLHEIKEFKVRIIYKRISGDALYIMLVKMKKSDNDKLNREEIINRNKNVTKDCKMVEKILADPVRSKELIELNEEIKKRIYDNLSASRRDTNARK